MADHTLTPDELAMIDATVARVAADRADAGIMGARYDAACEQIVKLLDEATAQRRRIAELEHLLGATPTTGKFRSRVIAAIRRVLAEAHDDWHLAGAITTAVMGEARPLINAQAAEIAELRAQLAATTRPEAALDRLAADAQPTAQPPAPDEWDAYYEPGNVSTYYIGRHPDMASAMQAAEAWFNSQRDETSPLAWEQDPSPLIDWWRLIEQDEPDVDTGVTVRPTAGGGQ